MNAKVRVWKDSPAKAKKVLVGMRNDGSDAVLIYLAREDGEQIPGTNLMRISPDGVMLYGSVAADAGIALEDGYVKTTEG